MKKQGEESESGRQTTGREQEIGGKAADPLTGKRMENVLTPRQERPGQLRWGTFSEVLEYV